MKAENQPNPTPTPSANMAWIAARLLPRKYGEKTESFAPASVQAENVPRPILTEELRMELIERRRQRMEKITQQGGLNDH